MLSIYVTYGGEQDTKDVPKDPSTPTLLVT